MIIVTMQIAIMIVAPAIMMMIMISEGISETRYCLWNSYILHKGFVYYEMFNSIDNIQRLPLGRNVHLLSLLSLTSTSLPGTK